MFLAVLCVERGIAVVWQLSQNVVLIDFAKKDFQLFQPVFGGGKAGLFLTDFRCLDRKSVV